MAYIYYAKPDIVDCKYSNLFVFIIKSRKLNLSDCKLQQSFVPNKTPGRSRKLQGGGAGGQ